MAGRKSSATVQHMQPLASSTMSSSRHELDAAGFEDVAVDADIAELVDHQRDAPLAGVLDQVADQRGLAGAEEARDDGGGDFLKHAQGSLLIAEGGRRPITPDFRKSGRNFQGMRPCGEAP